MNRMVRGLVSSLLLSAICYWIAGVLGVVCSVVACVWQMVYMMIFYPSTVAALGREVRRQKGALQ